MGLEPTPVLIHSQVLYQLSYGQHVVTFRGSDQPPSGRMRNAVTILTSLGPVATERFALPQSNDGWFTAT